MYPKVVYIIRRDPRSGGIPYDASTPEGREKRSQPSGEKSENKINTTRRDPRSGTESI